MNTNDGGPAVGWELAIDDMPAQVREQIQFLRRRLCTRNDEWLALCDVMQCLADLQSLTSRQSAGAVVAEVDGLLETQGRLQFARENYNEAEATDFGIRLLDFMRRHGVVVRQALAQWSHGECARP